MPARGTASAPSSRGATRSRRSASIARRARCATPAWTCRAIAAAACSSADAAHRTAALDDNRRAVDEAKALGAPCLVLVVGGLPQYSRPGSAASKDIAARARQVVDGIAAILEYARQVGHAARDRAAASCHAADRACVNTTDQALDICDALDPARTGALGVALDVYHIWWDPEAAADRARRPGPAARRSTSATGWCRPATSSTTAA